MTDRHHHLSIMVLACLLLPSKVESSLHHATDRRVTPTSTWKQTPSSSGLFSAPILTYSHTAFVPSSQRPGKVAIAGSIGLLGRQKAFLSHLVHQSYNIDSPSTSQSILHPRTPSCAARRHRLSTFLSSKIRADPSDNGNEETDIQRLYQQVQEEDSEWFYQTFSKLLDEDLTGKIESSREGALAKESKSNNYDGSSRESNLNSMSDDEDKVVVMADDGAKRNENQGESDELDQRKAVQTKELTPKDAINSVSTENVEPSPLSISGERKQPPIMQQSRRETEEEDDQALKKAVQRARASDDGTRNDDNNGGETYKGGNDEYENLDSYDEDDGYDDRAVPQPQRRQSPVSISQERPRAKDPQTKPSGNVSSPPIVRLRNTYDGDIETLGPLSEVLNIGYTEKEILVLRPKVLELIFEDRIPKPTKGLPKRWVRLSKLDGYEKEAKEEEDDEDFEWEVEVVSGKTLDEKVGSKDRDTKDSVGVKNDLIDDDKSSSVSKGKEQESDAKKETSGDVLIPRESRSRSQQPKEDPVVESWGPFTSSRVPDTDDEAVQYKTTTESGTRKKRQQPIKADDNANSRRNDDNERGSVDAKRRPTPQRRVSDDDDDGDEDSPSYSSKPAPQRTLDNQRRRQRQRPPARRRELLIDRGDDDEPPPNKFWMDLPTFRDILQKEAQFRLQILGPDWKESVLDESKWRYDLYKTWLTMLDEGVGENPLYEYGDRPRQPAERRRSSPQPRSRDEQRRSRGAPERDLEEKDYYDDDGGRPKRPKARSETRGEGRREGSRRVEPKASFDRRPPPPTTSGTWKNFSDLEESLQRSSQERLKPDRGSPNFRGDKVEAKKDYDESFDEEDDDAPGRKRRPTVRPQRENAKRGNDAPYDEEYDRSFKDEREDSPRRRSRVRSAAERSQGQNSRKVETSSEQDYDEPFED